MGMIEDRQRIHDRIRGSLLAGACGDALGAPVEFWSRAAILERFGSHGITSFAPAYGRIGAITDDTQMTLFTADGILRGHVRMHSKGICLYEGVIANAYARWLMTQGATSPMLERERADGWLFEMRELHALRAPGRTCLAALSRMAEPKPAKNDSKGCGGVMRVAPIGLFACSGDAGPGRTFEIATNAAALTHGHPTGHLTAGFFAVVVQHLVSGVALEPAIEAAKHLLCARPDHEETLAAIENAQRLAAAGGDRAAAIAKLGQGWIAEEALAISLYCALVEPNLRDAIVLAVNHDGDSDSTGSITGNLVGAMQGHGAIPAEWLDVLELRDAIETLATDLASFPDWDVESDAVWNRYPGW